MTHEVIRHLLDDYVTGDLADDAQAPVAEHVAGCEICSAEVESLKRIMSTAASMPKSIDPPDEAWTTIRAAIERDEKALTTPPMESRRMSAWRTPYAIAAAVVVAAILSSGGTYLFMRDRGPTGSNATMNAGTGTPATLAAFTVEENNYLRTASILQDLLDQQQSSLAPETVAQLKASLHTIDEAILEARGALARDPANKMLVEMLSASYRQKVDLLRRTTEMTRGS
jgi:anti-sigma-K factor RskA